MLLLLREFITREKVVSTQQLTREFRVDTQALLPMLACLVKKGIIRQCEQKTACKSSCFRCDKEPPQYYELFTL
jgi:hypothetical protein